MLTYHNTVMIALSINTAANYSKKMMKQNTPDVHFISHTLLLKACYKENSFQTRHSEKVNDYSFLPGPQ